MDTNKLTTLPNGIQVKAMSCEMDDGRKGFFLATNKSEKKIRETAILVKHSKVIKSVEITWDQPSEIVTDDGQKVQFGGNWVMQAWF